MLTTRGQPPPPPVRILFALLLLLGSSSSSNGRGSSSPVLWPGFIIILGQIHALAFHAPSILMMSTNKHINPQDCLRLTEHIMYYGLLQIAAIELLLLMTPPPQIMMDHEPTTTTTTACYCGLYYAWSIAQHALSLNKKCTLSSWGLSACIAFYVIITIPYCFHHHQHNNKNENDAVLLHKHAWNNLVAWSVAEMCHYVASFFFFFCPQASTPTTKARIEAM